MTETTDAIRVGVPLRGPGGHRIGTVDATFVDYLLVRTASLVPVDLYVPRPEVTVVAGQPTIGVGSREAYARWHRPLKRAPHGD